jgi:hypothetical protein
MESLALVLLAGAGVLLKSFSKVQAVDPGFDNDSGPREAQIVMRTWSLCFGTISTGDCGRTLIHWL